MKALVVVDGHLVKTPDGKVWSSKIYNYHFFERYLYVFDEIRVAIRIKEVESNKGYPNLCSGKNVEFYSIEEFKGPKEYIKKYLKIKNKIKESFKGCNCAIFRIPSTVGYQFLNQFRKTKLPFAIEVVVDPWDFAAPGNLNTPLRPFIRTIWTNKLKKACMIANGVSYVTKYALQERYPSYSKKNGETSDYFESYYSSVDIPNNYFGTPKKYEKNKKNYKIVHITNNIGNYVKGHIELIDAVSILKSKDIKVDVDFVGDGDLVEKFKKHSIKQGVKNQIRFVGKLSNSQDVRKKLLESDLFVFPSHAEGSPRVLIEAMAVGLPCISTNINGIPELLDSNFLIEVGKTDMLAEKIKMLITNNHLMENQSERNIQVAKNYSESKLQIKRNEFYRKLKNLAVKNNIK